MAQNSYALHYVTCSIQIKPGVFTNLQPMSRSWGVMCHGAAGSCAYHRNTTAAVTAWQAPRSKWLVNCAASESCQQTWGVALQRYTQVMCSCTAAEQLQSTCRQYIPTALRHSRASKCCLTAHAYGCSDTCSQPQPTALLHSRASGFGLSFCSRKSCMIGNTSRSTFLPIRMSK